MFAVRSLLRNNASIIKNVAQTRNMGVVAVPPRTKVSTGEILFLSAAMIVGWSAIPVWVLVNIKHYRDRD